MINLSTIKGFLNKVQAIKNFKKVFDIKKWLET